MANARNVIEAVRGLREDGGFEAKQAGEIGVAAARIVEASADRMLIRLGAWTLAVVALATTIIVAAMRLMLA